LEVHSVTDTERNKALVVEFWHAAFDDKERYFTDDIVWHLPPSVRQSGIETDVRRDGIADLFAMGFATYEPGMTWDVQHVLADDDLVALHVTMRGRTASGNTYHGPYHMLFRIDGDRIAEGWEFLDTAYVLERMAPPFPGGEVP
jgi:predicted SnoaL-like aldol condensation-catalyzing enzyme